ncbi:MAG TPA: hypothetical protein VG777_00885 [Thermoanaerobaculia bacterium]|nr:hypothetical protein [Thermoanaerobaculia bacterium]
MNILDQVRNAAGARLFLLIAATGLAALIAGITGTISPALAIFGVFAVAALPGLVGTVAYFWTITAEWAKLAVTETYSKMAWKQMQEAQSTDFRATLDSVGQEAYDELQAAIARRDGTDG